jgi:hypothetical protein
MRHIGPFARQTTIRWPVASTGRRRLPRAGVAIDVQQLCDVLGCEDLGLARRHRLFGNLAHRVFLAHPFEAGATAAKDEAWIAARDAQSAWAGRDA